VVTHPLQIERRPGKVRLSETDVLTTELRSQLYVVCMYVLHVGWCGVVVAVSCGS